MRIISLKPLRLIACLDFQERAADAWLYPPSLLERRSRSDAERVEAVSISRAVSIFASSFPRRHLCMLQQILQPHQALLYSRSCASIRLMYWTFARWTARWLNLKPSWHWRRCGARRYCASARATPLRPLPRLGCGGARWRMWRS
eukprot:SAG11_NODE_1711_length_4401_cov_4.188052_3_plen_145_part_00